MPHSSPDNHQKKPAGNAVNTDGPEWNKGVPAKKMTNAVKIQ